MTGEMRPARNTIMYHQILSFLADVGRKTERMNRFHLMMSI